MNYRTYLFDLDGTVLDTGAGVMGSVQYALENFGYPGEPEEKLRRFVGPSLYDSFTGDYGMSKEQAEEAIRLYRQHYRDGAMFEAEPYPGIRLVLETLRGNGRAVYIVTSKPLTMAEPVLRHFGLTECFDGLIGPDESDHSSDKEKLIRRALAMGDADPMLTVMIGDRKFDMEGAAAVGIDSIGVLYGFGEEEELRRAGATHLVSDPVEILDI